MSSTATATKPSGPGSADQAKPKGRSINLNSVLMEGRALIALLIIIVIFSVLSDNYAPATSTIARTTPGWSDGSAALAHDVDGAKALLDRIPAPSDEQIRNELSGNLCRCGTHVEILRAVRRAAARSGKVPRLRHLSGPGGCLTAVAVARCAAAGSGEVPRDRRLPRPFPRPNGSPPALRGLSSTRRSLSGRPGPQQPAEHPPRSVPSAAYRPPAAISPTL